MIIEMQSNLMKRVLVIVENLDASKVVLTDAEFKSLEDALNQCKVYGHRGLGGF